MITTILSDFSRVLLFPKDETYLGSLNDLNKKLMADFGDEYKFFDYFKINEELLEIYKELREKYPIYIFTTDIIQNRLEVKQYIDPIINGIFSAKDFNLKKANFESYTFISQKINKKPEEVLYIDDLMANIDAAKKAGMNVFPYKNNFDTRKILKLLLLVQ